MLSGVFHMRLEAFGLKYAGADVRAGRQSSYRGEPGHVIGGLGPEPCADPLAVIFPVIAVVEEESDVRPGLRSLMASVRNPVSMSVKSVVASPMTVQTFGGGGFLFW